jgi:dTDP-glucose 4,6-dehydratase
VTITPDNIGGGTELTNRELTERIITLLDASWDQVRLVPDRLGHDLRYSVDITKITTELGYRPQVEFDSGLLATVDWYRANRTWWEPIKAATAPAR